MPDNLFVFVAIGFLAQLIDGALGMAFGVLTTASLLAMGVSPAVASATTHVTELFTTAASGASHAYHRNLDWRLIGRLAPAGMIGGAIGAYLLVMVNGKAIMPFISIYLIAIGIYIIIRAFRPLQPREVADWSVPYVGFGGWGPIVTSSLVGRGHNPKKVIGSTNLTEFLVTLVISITFMLAVPIGAYLVSWLPVRPLMIAVGIVIIASSAMRLFG